MHQGTAVVAGLASTRTPRVMLIALVFFVPIALYFRYDTWLGHALPSVFAAAVLVGVSLSKEAAWGQLLRGSRRFVATAVLAFALLLGLSMVLVLLQRSPAVLGLLGRGEASGLFASGWTELRPQNTFPIVRGGGFLLGPVAGLAFLSFMTHTRREGDGGLGREDLLAALLLTSALNLVIAFGQSYVAGFPRREPLSLTSWALPQPGRPRAADDTRRTHRARPESSPDAETMASIARTRHGRACRCGLHPDPAAISAFGGHDGRRRFAHGLRDYLLS